MRRLRWPCFNLWQRAEVTPRRSVLNLDDRLLAWSARDWLTLRGMLANILILGKTGSGKTSGSGAALLRALLRHPHCSALVLASRSEDREMIARLAVEAGHLGEIVYLSLRDDVRINVFDLVLQMTGGSAREVVSFVMTVGETLRAGGRQGGDGDWQFWRQQHEMLLYHAVVLIKLALKRVSAPDLQRFIAEAPQSPEEIASEKWRAGFCSTVMQAALAAEKSPADAVDCEEAVSYFLHVWPLMADRTRSSVLTGVTGVLFAFCTGAARQLLSRDTNFDLRRVPQGTWLVVDMPPCVDGETGLVVGSSIKYLVQKLILRQSPTDDSYATVVWCDEFQQWVTSFDARVFLPTCRGHLGCLVGLTQSCHGLYTALDGGQGEHAALALISQFHHRLFHALGSAEDALHASELCGRRWTTVLGGSLAPPNDLTDSLFGRRRFTGSFSRQMEAVIPPRAFLNDLRCGGPANDFLTDAILVRTGEIFANRENYLRVTFKQS